MIYIPTNDIYVSLLFTMNNFTTCDLLEIKYFPQESTFVMLLMVHVVCIFLIFFNNYSSK